MTSKQLQKLKEELFKQENELYKVISRLNKIKFESDVLYVVPIEATRVNKIAETLRKLRLELPKPKIKQDIKIDKKEN